MIRTLIADLEITFRVLFASFSIFWLKRLIKSSPLNKRVLLRDLRSPPPLRIQIKESFKKIDKSFDRSKVTLPNLKTQFFLFPYKHLFQLIKRTKFNLGELLGFRYNFASCLDILFSSFNSPPLSLLVKEEISVSFACGRRAHNVLRYLSHDFNNPSYLVPFRIPWKKRYPNKQFSTNTPHTPHINSGIIFCFQNNFRRPIIPALDILKSGVSFETGGPKVYYFQIRGGYARLGRGA